MPLHQRLDTKYKFLDHTLDVDRGELLRGRASYRFQEERNPAPHQQLPTGSYDFASKIGLGLTFAHPSNSHALPHSQALPEAPASDRSEVGLEYPEAIAQE